MLAVELGHFSSSFTVPVAPAAPVEWINPGPESAIVCVADVDTYLSLAGEADAESGFMLLANVYARMRVDPGGQLSALAVAANGTLRLTRAGES